MRALVAAVVALAVSGPCSVHAQPRHDAQRGTTPPPPATAPRTTVPPPIDLPFPPLMPPPTGGLRPRGPDNPAFRPDRQHRQRFGFSGGFAPFFYGDPFYGYPDSGVPQTPAEAPARATGWLRLAVTPITAQVFVDGYYVGTVDDVNAKRELQLDAGPHRIEIRAPFYQPLVVDVQVAPNETVTYRGALDVIRPVPPPAPPLARGAAGAAEKMYVIPNCYIGNVPPRPGRLPAGCDIKHVQVLGAK